VSKLEKTNAPKVVVQPAINFEAAEKQIELDGVQEELRTQKAININLENQRRKPLREKYIKGKIFRWRLKTFAYLLFGIVIFLGALIYLYYLSSWNLKRATETYDNYKSNIFITSGIWLASAVYSG